MNKKKEIFEELKEIAPYLSALKNKKEPFKLPANYFDNFEANILQQVQQESVPSRPNKNPLFKITSIARKLVAIFTLGGISLFLWKQPPTNTLETTLSSEEIASYIADNVEEFEEDLFLEEAYDRQLVTGTNLNNNEIEIGIDDLLEDLEEADLEDLL